MYIIKYQCSDMCMTMVVVLQVYRRLNKLLLCLSHTRTLATLDKLGENFDEEVHQWMANLDSTLQSKVCTTVDDYSKSVA